MYLINHFICWLINPFVDMLLQTDACRYNLPLFLVKKSLMVSSMRSTKKIGAKISPSLFGFFFFGVFVFLVLHVVWWFVSNQIYSAVGFCALLCRVSFLRASVRRSFLWSGFGMSIKSTTIIPPYLAVWVVLQFL